MRVHDDGHKAVSYIVTGAHCAACISKIENAVRQYDSHVSARLNFSTGRLNVVFDGQDEIANDYARDIAGLGYGVHPVFEDKAEQEAERENRFLLLCLGVAGFAAGNLMLLSIGLWTTSIETMGHSTREFLHWISALIAIPTILFSGRPFFRSALGALKTRQTNMDVPIAVALVLVSGMSLYETAYGGEHVYFDSAVMLIFFLLIGRYLDFRAKRTARGAATKLLDSFRGFATVVTGHSQKRVLISSLKPGMTVLVAAGERIAADGVVVADGESDVDMSLITGETMPQAVAAGDHVFAGTLNLSSSLTVRVEKETENTLLSDIVRMMELAEQGHAKYTRLADKAARLYTPFVHGFALIAFIVWWGMLGASWQVSAMTAITVLIITCPCALGLAVPVVQVLASSRLMQRGVYLKSGDALERMAGIDVAVFDKTGTLTTGRPSLVTQDVKRKDLALAASLARHSKHPLSQAIVAAYEQKRNPRYRKVEDIKTVSGSGMTGQIDGAALCIGNRDFCGVGPKDGETGHMEIWMRHGDHDPVQFCFEDPLRPDAQAVIAALKQNNILPVLLSGDRNDIVADVAAACGIETARGQQTPQDKYEYLERLKADGHCILMVGDGLNDAAVLAAANVSVAPSTAIDIAQNTADIVFTGSALQPVLDVYDTAQKTGTLVRQNFALAILYNIIAVPVAFAGFVTPLIAALAMSGSSLVVIANSFRLRLRA